MSEIERQSAGAPNGSGGEFAQRRGITAPEGPLMESAYGSYLFQPLYYGENNSVPEYVQFWKTIPIPDRALSNIISAHRAQRDTTIGSALRDWAEKYDNDPAVRDWEMKPENSRADVLVEREDKRQDEITRLEREYKKVTNANVRVIAVALQMYRCSAAFTKEEQAEIDGYSLSWSRDSSTTVREVWEDYRLSEIADAALTDGDVAVQTELAELRRRLDEQGE